MKKGYPLFVAAVLIFFLFTMDQRVSANTGQSDIGADIQAERFDDTFTMTAETAEGTLTVVQDKATKRFLSLEADYLNKKQEAEQFKLLKQVEVKEVGASTKAAVGRGTNTYNKWYYGKWRNYTVTFEQKTTISIVVWILAAIPYVERVAGLIAALIILWEIKAGYFSAKLDYKFLGGKDMQVREHLKIWEKKNYTKLLEYKVAERKVRGR